jgi:hypothetical protein
MLVFWLLLSSCQGLMYEATENWFDDDKIVANFVPSKFPALWYQSTGYRRMEAKDDSDRHWERHGEC